MVNMEDEKKTREQLIGEAGHEPGVITGCRDMTMQKQTEGALQTNEETARAILNASQDSIVLLDRAGTVLDSNKNHAARLQTSREALIGRCIWDYFPKAISENRKRHLEDVFATGRAVRFEDKRSGKWNDIAFEPIFDGKGNVSRVAVYIQNITERRAAEERLLESEQRFRHISAITSDIFYSCESEQGGSYRIDWMSGATERIIGYSVDEIKIQGCWSFLVIEEDKHIFESDVIGLAPGTSAATELRLRHKDGQIVWIESNATCIHHSRKHHKHILYGSCTDITERKQAETALRESEERYKSFIDNSFAGVYVVQNSIFRFLNDNAASFAGYRPEELVGRKADSIVHPEDRSTVKERSKRMFGGEDMSPYEFRIITKDGQLRWIMETVSLIPYGGEKAILGNSMDITDRKRAEEALQASQELEISILQSVPHALFGVENRRIFFANEAMGEIFGWEPGELIGKSTRVIFRNDREWETYGAILYSQLKLHQVFVFEWDTPFVRRDGKEIFCRMSVSRSGNELGKNRRIVATFEDITERRRIEAENEQKQKLNEMLLNSLPHPTMLVRGRDKVVLAANSIALRAGVKIGSQCWRHLWKAEFIGEKDKALITAYPDIVPGEFGVKCKFCRGDQCLSELPEQNNPHVEAFDRNWDIYWIKASEDAYLHYAIDMTDINKSEKERRELETRLQRSEKMEALGTMAGGVAHDLNNVLGIVVGYAEMLMDEMDESNPLREDVMKIMEGGNRSAAIVQDLLTLARRGVQTQKVINLNDTIKGYQKTPEFEVLFSSNRHIKLKTDLETDLLNIMGSPVHLGKTFINLVTNAVESMPGGGALTIATRNQSLDKPIHGYDAVNEGDYVVLSITDTGEGIFDHDIRHVFEPFYTKKVMGRSGTGLGLAVVWGTVKDHNGYIDVMSEVGKGTTFTLYFPVSREEIAKVDTAMPLSEYIGKDESILVIDDIKEQRELATKMLGKLNYRVKAVSSGEEAVEYLKTNKADLLVLDMIMDPGMDGLDTYKAILELHPKQKAIIVSGFSETERVKETKALGAGNYLRKPYVIEKLGLAARKELDRQ